MAEALARRSGLVVVLVATTSSIAHAGPRSYAGPVDTAGTPAPVDEASTPAEPAPLEQLPPPPEPAPLEQPRAKRSPVSEIDPLGVRVVRVDSDALRGSTRAEAYRHAGGRSIVSMQRAFDRGAASVGEALERAPGVRAPEGISGVGGPTRLNVAVRGASPRLSEEATVLLDEVPIAMAPYGQPAMSLFPISPFSIDRVDAVRSGASVRFGPTTVGGVFNLVSKPIPEVAEVKVASRIDRWGTYQGAAGFGTTAGKFGVWAEYAPQAGRTFRDNSEFQAHGTLLKLVYKPVDKLEIASTTHGYYEHTSLPGGISLAAYDRDPFQSTRSGDLFQGWRVGESLKVRYQPRENHELGLIAWYSRSYRDTLFHHVPPDNITVDLPRNYHVVGVEPRYAVRVRHKSGAHHDLGFGVRGVFERGHVGRTEFLAGMPDRPVPRSDDDIRLGALAVYAEDELYLADDAVVIRAGIRGEVARLSSRDNVEQRINPDAAIKSRTFVEPLPSVSIRYDPIDELGMFLAYTRSFSAPSFVGTTLSDASQNQKYAPSIADTVELGLKVAEAGGLYGEATGWFRHYGNQRDEGENSSDVIGNWYGGGAEVDFEWEPGEVWRELEGSSLYGGYAYTNTRIYDSNLFNGKAMPWFPRHELWSGLAYSLPWRCGFFESLPGPDDCRALKLGADVSYSGAQFSYFDDDSTPGNANGSTGLIPAYALVDVYLKFTTMLPRAWVLNLSLGIKNVANTAWYYRTDDLNRGILAQRPRTFFVGLDIGYTFFEAHARAEARRKRRAEARR